MMRLSRSENQKRHKGSANVSNGTETLNCLVYVPNIYNGEGTTQTLVWIIQSFPLAGIHPILFFERTWKFPETVSSVSLFPKQFGRLPGWSTQIFPKWLLEWRFLRCLKKTSAVNSFVYIWPQPRLQLIQKIKSLGFCVFREMINCPGRLYFDEVRLARQNAGLEGLGDLNESAIFEELNHLNLSDFITAPNSEVERGLRQFLPSEKIMSTSFGWAQDRFPRLAHGKTSADAHFCNFGAPTFLYVGSLSVRKGIHYLLKAWSGMPEAASLVLVGSVDTDLKDLLEIALRTPNIMHKPFTKDLEPAFGSADVFVFPTVEEGGPQVTCEAAGCGLPVITTPMGSARLIKDDRNGLIVPAHDIESLRTAMLSLVHDPERRARLGKQAQIDAQAFTYDQVGYSRAVLFREKFFEYRRRNNNRA